MVTFSKQPDKDPKVSVAGRAPSEVKKHIEDIARKYNMTSSQVLCEILVAWHNGETFKEDSTSKLSVATKKVKRLEKEIAIRKESIVQFIRNDVAEEGAYEDWANSYNNVLKKVRKKFQEMYNEYQVHQNNNSLYESTQLALSKIDWKITITITLVSVILFLVWWHDQKNDSHHKDLKISLKKMRELVNQQVHKKKDQL